MHFTSKYFICGQQQQIYEKVMSFEWRYDGPITSACVHIYMIDNFQKVSASVCPSVCSPEVDNVKRDHTNNQCISIDLTIGIEIK